MSIITPNWPAPTWVSAFTTLRTGGVSKPPFDSFNFGEAVGDSPENVAFNRLRLTQSYSLPQEPVWLAQTHSADLIEITRERNFSRTADGAWTLLPNTPCVVTTADCLPLLLCDTSGTLVAAIHCGWRGILRGIIEKAIFTFKQKSQGDILAWLGPAIGPDHFEVGQEVKAQFTGLDPALAFAFKPAQMPHKWLANLYELARIKLHQLGVNQIWGGNYCTYSDPTRFYSYRRDGKTGRMASVIWLKEH